LELLFGLFLADGMDEPMMLACSVLVDEGIVRTPGGASKLLHHFERHGVIWSPGAMPKIKGRPYGTRLFLPGPQPPSPEPEGGWRVLPALDRAPVPALEDAAIPIEAEDVVGRVAVDPAMEAPDEASVRNAVAGASAGGLNRRRGCG
jgi:hypothetical protein